MCSLIYNSTISLHGDVITSNIQVIIYSINFIEINVSLDLEFRRNTASYRLRVSLKFKYQVHYNYEGFVSCRPCIIVIASDVIAL